MAAKNTNPKTVETLRHGDATRRNIPTAEFQTALDQEEQAARAVAYARRNRDLDPQLVWRGKDVVDWSDLVVQAPPLYIQEKIHPKALIDDLLRQTADARAGSQGSQLDLFADFNGLPSEEAKTEFYRHDQNWSNRMILGDSLQVMASLAEREGLRGKVQCIYFDPPYGIKFNSNFQWSTTSRDVKDGNAGHITREPEQVKAFRDTWRDGIHSYLTYLRDRLTVARDLLAESGSIFVQIGDENVHRVRAVMEEVFGEENFVSTISYKTSIGLGSDLIDNTCNYLVWYARKRETLKFRPIFKVLEAGKQGATRYKKVRLPDLSERPAKAEELEDPDLLPVGARLFRDQGLTSRSASATTIFSVLAFGNAYQPSSGGWRTSESGMARVLRADRVLKTGQNLSYRKFFDDFSALSVDNFWADVSGGITSRTDPKVYVVQTATSIIERCILMTTDPGDLCLDPTCGSGTTAYVAEQWGRRWITIDTSRVALALARARLMGARYPYYLLADSREGQVKEAEVTRTIPSSQPTGGRLRQGFVYERVPHITLKSIANNSEIDVIWETWQGTLEPLRAALNAARGQSWQEWEVPREGAGWPEADRRLLQEWWQARVARQKEIDASIAAKAEFEYLYDRPYEDKKRVRVAGPFTVESLSPHRVLGVDEDDELIDPLKEGGVAYGEGQDFVSMILDNLKTSGVQQAHKEDRITFTALTPWPGDLVCAEGLYSEGESGRTRRAAVFVGPEFGTVSRPDLVAAAREAADSGFDVLVACAFNYEAHTTEFSKLGRIPVLKARMNADLHMAGELKNTGKGNLFVIFGEPDIDLLRVSGPHGSGSDGGRGTGPHGPGSDGGGGTGPHGPGSDGGGGTGPHGPGSDGEWVQVKLNGVDVFHPNTGEVRSNGPDEIALWFVDTDYNEEGFFVRHAYFLGANDPYGALKTTLKAEIDEAAWASLYSAVSRPFPKPRSGRVAVKVINHLGDEVMKVFRVK